MAVKAPFLVHRRIFKKSQISHGVQTDPLPRVETPKPPFSAFSQLTRLPAPSRGEPSAYTTPLTAAASAPKKTPLSREQRKRGVAQKGQRCPARATSGFRSMESDETGGPGFSFDKSHNHKNGNFLDRTPGLDAQNARRLASALIEVSHELGHIPGHKARHLTRNRMLLPRIVINRFPYLGFRQGYEFRPCRWQFKYMSVHFQSSLPRPKRTVSRDFSGDRGARNRTGRRSVFTLTRY